MCQRVDCQNCGKPTWVGCGRHIEQALAGVPEADRCHCDQEEAPAVVIAPPAMPKPIEQPRARSFIDRLLGR